jgi:lysophospholipase L1-like esterase
VAHIVLIGDSIFDNSSYTQGAPDVLSHLRNAIPKGWRATLLAVDGATTAAIGAQLQRLPKDATHLVVSVGGNDALGHVNLLNARVSTTVEALDSFAPHVDRFHREYRAAIAGATAHALPAIVCTIYNGRLDRPVATAARMALSLFNDVILRTAAELDLRVIELRDVCDSPADYANPIEPSDSGGKKIARAILDAVRAST